MVPEMVFDCQVSTEQRISTEWYSGMNYTGDQELNER